MRFITAAARDEYILERHAEHTPLRDIGKQVEMSHEGVRQVILKAFAQSRKADIVRMIQAEGEHLADEAIANLREMALDKTIPPRSRTEAWDRARLWHESKRKLFGADAPVRRELAISDTSTWELALAADIAATERANEARAAEAVARDRQ